MYYPDGTHYSMMDGGGWMVGFGVLVLVFLLVATVAVLANLWLHLSRRPPGSGAGGGQRTASEARLVLDARLARGEVTPEEYGAVRALIEA